MKRIYTIEDVKEMLESKGYKMSGNFYDKRRTRALTNEDLWKNDNFELGTHYNNLTSLTIFTINEFEFIRGVGLRSDDDWTAEWQQLLLDKYPEYASMLLKHAEENIKKLDSYLAAETQSLINKLTTLKRNTYQKQSRFIDMEIKAEKYIQLNEDKQLEKNLENFRPYLDEDFDQ